MMLLLLLMMKMTTVLIPCCLFYHGILHDSMKLDTVLHFNVYICD